MDIPQNIKNQFIVREDYLEWIKEETAIFVYLDLTNMFHWQDILGWRFRMEDVIEQLFTFPNIKEIKVYYGLNPRDPSDANGDLDNDGLKNKDEFIKKTDPKDPDTDKDGIRDGDDPEPAIPNAPKILNTYPRNAMTVIVANFINATTDKNSICRFGPEDRPFDEMPNSFTESTGIEHKSTFTPASGENTVFMRCKDTFGNKMQESYKLQFVFDNAVLGIVNSFPTSADKVNVLSFDVGVTTTRKAVCVASPTQAALSFTLPAMATTDNLHHTQAVSIRSQVDPLLAACSSDTTRESDTSLSANVKYWSCSSLGKFTNLCSNVVRSDEKTGCNNEYSDYLKIKSGENVPTQNTDDEKFKQAIQKNTITLCDGIQNDMRKTGCKAAVSQNPNYCIPTVCPTIYQTTYNYFAQCKDEYDRQLAKPATITIRLNDVPPPIPIIQ